MSDQTFSLSGFSPIEPNQVKRGYINPVNSGGMELEEPEVPDMNTFIPVNSGGVSVSETEEKKRLMDDAIRSFVAAGNNPTEEQAKIDVSRFLSSQLGISFEGIYDNYEENIEHILGYTLKPKAATKFIVDQYTTKDIDVEISELMMQKLRTPGADHTALEAEMQRLEETKPPIDPFKHSILIDSIGTAASMIPFIKEVGQYAIPGMAISLAAGAVSGGSGTLAAAAPVLKTIGSLVSIWGRAKSFDVGYTQAAGSLYGTLSNMVDENGEPIDDGIARKVSMIAALPIAGLEAIGAEFFITGNSVFKTLAQRIGGEALRKRTEMAAAKTLTELTIKGFFVEQTKRMAKRTGEMLIHEILLEEVPQDLMEVQAVEMAKHFTNDLMGTEFKDITSEEQLARTREVIAESFKGMLVLGLGKSTLGMAWDYGAYVKDRISTDKKTAELEAIQEEDNILDFYVKATPEQAAELEKVQLEEAELESFKMVDTTIDEKTVTATTATGAEAGTTAYEVTDDTVTITSMDVAEAQKLSTAQRMVQTLQNQFPDKKIVLSPEASAVDTIGRALEDLDPEMQIINAKIDEVNISIESAEQNIQEQTEAIEALEETLAAETEAEAKVNLQTQIEQAQEQITADEESIAVDRVTLENAQATKVDMAEAPVKKVKDMTAKEYEKIIQFPIDEAKRFVKTPAGQKLRADIAKQTTFTEDKLDLAVDLVEMAANAKNMTPKAWLAESIKGIAKGDKRGRGSVLFDKEGKAIIRLTKKSDFTTWVHELSHILRQQLAGKDLATATVWAEGQTGDIVKGGAWTVAMEEAFAAGFERYISEGKTEHKEMKTIFDKLAKFMRAIYDSLKHLPQISPEIRAVFENQLSTTRIDQLEKGTATEAVGELYQPKYQKAIEKAVREGREVREDILQQFPKEKWATKALAEREANRQKLKDFDWLSDMAIRSKDLEAFIEEAQFGFYEEIDQLKGKDVAWLTEFYELATRDIGITDINTGNKRWAEGLDDDYIKNIITEASRDIKQARDIGLPQAVTMAAARYKSKETISDTQIQVIRKTFQNNPAAYRQMVAEFIGDIEEAQRVDIEREFAGEIGIEEDIPVDKMIRTRMNLAEDIDDITTKKKIQKGIISTKDLNKILKDTSKELKSSDVEVNKLEADLQEQDRLLAERLRKIVDVREREKQATKDEKRQAVKEAIAKEKTRKSALIKKQKDTKKLRDHINKLGKQITKKIPASVDITYVGLIKEIQDKVQGKFLRKDKLTEKQFLRKYYENNPELADIMPKDFISNLQSKSLNEWDVGELEFIKAKIDQLKNAGKAKYALRKAILKDATDQAVIDIETQIRAGKEVDVKEFGLGEGLTGRDKAIAAILKTYRPSRVADKLDGGADYKGPVVKLVIDEVNIAYDNELRGKHKRQTAFKNEMIRLGLKNTDFERIVEIRGIKVSIDEIMDVYAGYKNEKKKAALQGDAQKITQEVHDEMVAELSDTEKQFADFIISEYSENYPRLKQAFMDDKNIDIGEEENYTPIRRALWGLSADEIDVVQELTGRQQYGKGATIQKKFGIARIEIAPEHQSEITLGLVAAWHGEVAKQEHYINNAAVVKKINTVLNHRNVKAAAKDMGKAAHLQELKDYTKRYANPSIYKSNKGWDSAVKILKNNSAIAYLAYNIVTMGKQLPSLIYYTAYSSPPAIMEAIYLTATDWKGQRALMEKYAPQISYGRSMEAYIESLKVKGKSKTLNLIKQIGSNGMKGIEFFDRMTVTAGWTAVYNKHRRNGTSETESARLATQATLHTQPAAGAKDVAALYADDNFLTVFLQFSNQLNQLWNIISYDAPQAFKHRHFLKGTAMYSGIILSSMVMWMISNRRLPEDSEDYVDVFTDQFFSIMPGLGRTMGNYVDGYDLSIPILAPIRAGSAAIQVGKRLFSGGDVTDIQVERLLSDLHEGLAIGTGLPYTEIDRIYKGFKKGKPFQYIVFGGELNDK